MRYESLPAPLPSWVPKPVFNAIKYVKLYVVKKVD